jgi:hypothetical protein
MEAARSGGGTSLVEGYQILQCVEEYPGSVGRGSFPGIFQGADHQILQTRNTSIYYTKDY